MELLSHLRLEVWAHGLDRKNLRLEDCPLARRAWKIADRHRWVADAHRWLDLAKWLGESGSRQSGHPRGDAARSAHEFEGRASRTEDMVEGEYART